MKANKFVSAILVLALVLAGIFMLAQQGSIGVESLERHEAVVGMLSPAGNNTTTNTDDIPDTSLTYTADPVTSIPVRDMPVGEYFPGFEQYERWLNGETDLDFEGIPPALQESLLQEALNLPEYSPRPPSSLTPTLLGGFDSLDSNNCCGGATVIPPDPELAAGPNHLIAAVNLSFEIYDVNTGTSPIGPITYATFFSSSASTSCTATAGVGPFDPNVLYDEEYDRFIIAAAGDNGTAYCIGVSQTGDPLSAWCLYAFENVDVGGQFFDYPHTGIGDDAFYMGANLFGSGQGWVYAMDKTAMYGCAPAPIVQRQINSGHHTPQPLNLHGFAQGTWPAAGDPHYFIAGEAFGNANNYLLYSWDDPFGANNLTLTANFNLPTIHGVTVGSPVQSPQQGGTALTGNDPRPLDFEYRNGSGWTTMTVSCNPGGGTVNCIQWAEIDLGTQTVVQTDVFASKNQHRFFPDLAVDDCGNAMVGYTKSNEDNFPGIWAAGPLVAGSNPGEMEMKAGEMTYSAFANRWGDYTGMTIDPAGETFYYLGEYSKDNGNGIANWGTWVGMASFGCNDNSVWMASTTPLNGTMPNPGDTIQWESTITNSGVNGTAMARVILTRPGQPDIVLAGPQAITLTTGQTITTILTYTVPTTATIGQLFEIVTEVVGGGNIDTDAVTYIVQ